MSAHCCNTDSTPRHLPCPGCGAPGAAVSPTTLQHQLRQPWRQSPGDQNFFFCEQSGCDVVYFSADGAAYHASALRQPVGQKSTQHDRTLCYCFDIRHSDLADAETTRKCRDYVINETREQRCACEQRNPSGRCCLRDFPEMKE